MRFFSVVLVLASTVATLALPAPAEVTNIGKILTDISAISGVVSALDLDIGLINTKPSDAQVTAIAQAGIELPSKLAQLTNDIKAAGTFSDADSQEIVRVITSLGRAIQAGFGHLVDKKPYLIQLPGISSRIALGLHLVEGSGSAMISSLEQAISVKYRAAVFGVAVGIKTSIERAENAFR